MELDGVLNGETQEIEQAKGVTEQQPEQQEPEVKEPQARAEPEAKPESPPPGDEHDKHVPLAALEAVRKEKTDWKEKAIRAEAELNAFREQQQRTQQPQEQQPIDPLEFAQHLALNERLNMSEMLARKEHADMDEMLGVFEQAVKQNPALGAELKKQTHPWEWVYQQGKKFKLMQEMGDDPEAYRKRLEDEIRAKLTAEATPPAQPAVQTPPVQIPQSLAGERSAGARSAPTWSGPSPLESILK